MNDYRSYRTPALSLTFPANQNLPALSLGGREWASAVGEPIRGRGRATLLMLSHPQRPAER